MTESYIARMDAEQAKAAQRRETLDELRGELDRMHRKALQESPYSTYVSRVPISLLAKLSSAERDQIENFEQQAFARHQPMAQAREQQRTAFVAAGGEAEAFDSFWEAGGKDAHAAQVAEENLERARREDNVFNERKVSAP